MCGYWIWGQNCIHFSRRGCTIVPKRVRASIYLSPLITSRSHLSISAFQPLWTASATPQSLPMGLISCSFFFLGHQILSSHLHSTNSHHFFYLTWPQPSRLCVLFPYSIMLVYLGENSSHSIKLLPCKTRSFAFPIASIVLCTQSMFRTCLLKEIVFICYIFWYHPHLFTYLLAGRWQGAVCVREALKLFANTKSPDCRVS